MSVFTSPYNSPEAQFERLSRLRPDYSAKKSSIAEDWGPLTVAACILLAFAWFFHLYLPLVSNLFFLGALALVGFQIFRITRIRESPPHDYLTCPYCKERMSITAPWTCGHCGLENTADFNKSGHPTFVERCTRCTQTPHSLSCRQCGKPIVFALKVFNRLPDEITYLTGFPPAPAEHADTLEERRKRIKSTWQ
jgi:hypothetical protein